MTAMEKALETLLPWPKKMELAGEPFVLPESVGVTVVPDAEGPTLERLRDAFGKTGEGSDLVLELASGFPAQGYALDVGASGMRVRASDAAGLAHGMRTLTQLVEAAEARRVPGVEIEDAPDFPQRGVMLDVSRDRIPTMETLYAIVDRLAAWKINQLQLYVEHTFAYEGHETVWRGWDPLTPEEIRALDDYCAARHVDLVPNQQSFGHMHHWLVHERYRDLAECPSGVKHPFLAPGSTEREPFSLCPTDPRVLELLGGLYDQLLPCFRSTTFNIGFDETFDLGLGRSAAACKERGTERVYLEFLQSVSELARAHGRRPQFWADIILNHAHLVPELPTDAVPMIWGYEADHPFERETAAVAAAGLDFVVCPGTCSWQSLAGRLGNMTANVESAVHHGRHNGAAGVLVTDWGDRGHLQPLTASWPGWITAADLAWNADAPARRRSAGPLAALVSRHVFEDPTRAAGHALIRLARLGVLTGARTRNATALSLILTEVGRRFPPPSIENLEPEGLERALVEADAALEELTVAEMACADRALVRDELVWSAGVLRFACLLGLQRLHAGPRSRLSQVPEDARAPLRAELAALIAEHRRIWPLRSRPGGLDRSAAWLERVLKEL